MDQQEQQRINEAAEQFTDALVQSYRAVSQRGESAQEQNAQLTQDFVNKVIENLRTQTEESRDLTQQLADQQQRRAEATQSIARESVNAYMDFVRSAFSFYQGVAQRAGQETGRERPEQS
jgi:hypothetical protein